MTLSGKSLKTTDITFDWSKNTVVQNYDYYDYCYAQYKDGFLDWIFSIKGLRWVS